MIKWSSFREFVNSKLVIFLMVGALIPPIIEGLELFDSNGNIALIIDRFRGYYIAIAFLSVFSWIVKLFCPITVKLYQDANEFHKNDVALWTEDKKYETINIFQKCGEFKNVSPGNIKTEQIAWVLYENENDSRRVLFYIAFIPLIAGLSIYLYYFFSRLYTMIILWL